MAAAVLHQEGTMPPDNNTLPNQSNDLTVKKRYGVMLKSEVYNLYNNFKKRAGYSNDSSFMIFLLSSSISQLQTAGTTYDATEAAEFEDSYDDSKRRIYFTNDTLRDMTLSHDVLDSLVNSLTQSSETRDFHNEADDVSKNNTMQEKTNDELQYEQTIDNMAENYDESGCYFTCPRCGRVTMNPTEQAEHQKNCDILAKYRHTKRYAPAQYVYCSFCGMRLNDSSQLKQHFNKYHSNRTDLYTCEYCYKKQAFTDKRLLKAHKKTEPVCQACHRSYGRMDTLQLHVRNKNHLADGLKKGKLDQSDSSRTKYSSKKEHSEDGYNIMTVKLNPLHRLSASQNRVIVVPETANRQGYTIKAEFLDPPYPSPELFTEVDLRQQE